MTLMYTAHRTPPVNRNLYAKEYNWKNDFIIAGKKIAMWRDSSHEIALLKGSFSSFDASKAKVLAEKVGGKLYLRIDKDGVFEKLKQNNIKFGLPEATSWIIVAVPLPGFERTGEPPSLIKDLKSNLPIAEPGNK